ncbi:MAG TPA: hypothetical protein VFP71_13705 [Candidatus Angelobacter sp.]|nr:hypothetical protein [Candidatus Angelobacter sp.]
MQFSLIEWAIIAVAAVAICIQTFTLRIIKRRKLRTEFPMFFRYSAFCALGTAIGLFLFIVASCCNRQHFYVYWGLNIGTMLLEFAVLYELLVNALKPYSALIDLGKMLFRWAAVFLVLAALLTAFATAGAGHDRMQAAVDLLQRTVRLMQCGLLLLFLGLEKRLGLSWRTHSMSIALGLGIYAAIDLCATYLVDRIPAHAEAFQLFTYVVYAAAASLWAVSLARPEPARNNVLDSPSRLIFQRWNDVLVSTARFSPAPAAVIGGIDSFLPNVEQTVDRVLARKIVQ